MNQFRTSGFQGLPTVVKNLLIVNVLFFLATNTIGASGLVNMVDLFGLHHVKSPLFKPWQIVTHLFMHAGIWHLLGNMLGLWFLGTQLEYIWGSKTFLTFYFLCGIGAGLIQLVSLWYQYQPLVDEFMQIKEHITPDGVITFYKHFGYGDYPDAPTILNNYLSDPGNGSNMSAAMSVISRATYRILSNPTIGASGAVFGILAAFVYLFPNTSLYIYGVFPLKAKWIGIFSFGYEIFSGIQNSEGDNIAHWAHIGGGLVGFLLVLTWNKKNRRDFY